MKINIPSQVNNVLEILNQSHYSAFVVGGCIRDNYMGIEPKDWDVATSAKPGEIINLFKGWKVVTTGIEHGTVTLISEGFPIEVTTFRVDGKYSDNRHPEQISFTNSIEEDLNRRDFTINALAYSPKEGLIDPFFGMKDIDAGVIRAVGEGDKRFKEDALRILRGLRFAATLGFTIEEKTEEGIKENRALLKNIAFERINAEFCKLITGPSAGEILMKYKDVFSVFIPEIEGSFGFDQNDKRHSYDLWEHTCRSVDFAPLNVGVRLAILLYDLRKPETYSADGKGEGDFREHAATSSKIAKDIMERLKFDKRTSEEVLSLVSNHDIEMIPKNSHIKKILRDMGKDNFLRLLEVKRADIMAQSDIHREEKLAKISSCREIFDLIMRERQCFRIEDLAVTGTTLIEEGYQKGPEIGKLLNAALTAVMEDEIINSKEVILGFLKTLTKSNNN